MVGRVIFAFSSAVVNSMFPLVAGTAMRKRERLRPLTTSLLLVLTIGSVLALGLRVAPAALWTSSFGSGFTIVENTDFHICLALYAITTVFIRSAL